MATRQANRSETLHAAMQLAYKPRKASNPDTFGLTPVRHSFIGRLGRSRPVKILALAGLSLLTLAWLVARTRHDEGGARQLRLSKKSPVVVVVTVLDEDRYPAGYLNTVRENRMQYAEKHGYQTFFAKVGDYEMKGAPASWTKVVATRHALTKFPDCYYLWYLDQDSFVMNPQLTVEEHVMVPERVEALMLKEQPVVLPDSIIKTLGHLSGGDVEMVLTQDKEGLSVGSFVLRNGEWAKYLLETWFDPTYRDYNFQRAEVHALEHVVQWHPTILSHVSLVPQNIINSYSKGDKGTAYKDGDFAVRFPDCGAKEPQNCEVESRRFAQQWRTSFKNA